MITYSVNTFGLREKDMQYMAALFRSNPAIEKVILYGSRARGDFRRGSDVDLAVKGKAISFSDITRMHGMPEEDSPTLLWFDVLHYDTLTNDKLRQSIDRDGMVIYEKKDLPG